MATQRVVDYWHKPAPDGFVEYLFTAAHLRGKYLEIARNYRAETEGDTQFYADLAGLDKTDFNRKSGTMHRAIVAALIELAIDGWKARLKEVQHDAKI